MGTAWNFGHVISYFSCSLAVAVMNLVSDGVCRRRRESARLERLDRHTRIKFSFVLVDIIYRLLFYGSHVFDMWF